MLQGLGLDLAALQRAYVDGTTTPTAVIRAISDALTARGDDGIWLYKEPAEGLLARAADLESLPVAERARLPLWGVPFAVKDNIDLAGAPTTAACPGFSYLPKESATAVGRLVAAGAIPIGKTNLDQFASGLVGARTPGTVPVNPFDPSYVCGGSSAGSAVAVSCGLVSFALGTDTAGSGRVPAGLCNIVGLKPTRGRVSTMGVVPASRSLDCVSVFALTVEDAMAVLAVAEGEDDRDRYSRAVPAALPPAPRGAFRFGCPSRDTRSFDGDAVAEAEFDAAVRRLTDLGGTAVELDFAPFIEAASLLYGPLVAERYADLRDYLGDMLPVTRQIIGSGASVGGGDVYRAQHRLAALAAPLRRMWRDLDCIAVPTIPRPVRLDEVAADPLGPNAMLGTYTNFVNLMDLAGIAVPAGFRPDGIPHGITLLGPAFGEAGLAALASRFHRQVSLPLGATGKFLADVPLPGGAAPDGGLLSIAVFGAHLSGERLNHQLLGLGGRLDRICLTAPVYRMFGLPDGRPGLVRAPAEGGAIEGEIWLLPPEGFGRFVAAIPGPLGIGRVVLADGAELPGFLCEPYAVAEAPDITHFGGWRAWRASVS